MHQPFQRIFPDHSREAWCRRRRLKKNNAYSLPAGDYLIFDLYPSALDDPSVIYLLIQHARSQTHLATLELSFNAENVHLRLSHEHLQSPAAPQTFELVKDTLSQESALQEELWERMQEVGWMHRELLQQPAASESSLLSEMTIQSLAAAMESLMQETHPRQWESLLDSMLGSLKHELMAAMHEHVASQNKVVSLSAVRKQKEAAQKKPD
ncbi:hypothetical protein COW36_17680 [bacterium (Candidatus Blackallbacteria) CG17_big_fil_post_rev_8_21_14_2_50_48_46]|uniref:Uncharacterized protein n=1 Tax=bacterium (Candidatus Blackallbacteria) CG17_big_fil_post_rev_8_21_14_2_50_48_46 TaxID=2014261 RepID=A0A2M7G1P1_9BACT|nr:MAG: hypothetical protein COW64_01045 [bacterium (Candidatus Blackallbacteria) CG18_big_fil_WC_8_21_14_2_50_49_26]PIW15250.1 MAG: hypothetical protein COW36_17680 [bacterium (Candidatus Blackallbacteria) CG17_big_fil_post_rev_8_21_14_2_50_48_46]PIW45241.1 MAG: hypothetical protein COW20_21335 [bacterium (Candidatus Blackallbacteria) CG13_big_fil_rev_8_21_14_2_50_49_14]